MGRSKQTKWPKDVRSAKASGVLWIAALCYARKWAVAIWRAAGVLFLGFSFRGVAGSAEVAGPPDEDEDGYVTETRCDGDVIGDIWGCAFDATGEYHDGERTAEDIVCST